MVMWLQNTLTQVELYFSKEILDDDRLTGTLSAYLDKRDLGGFYSWADWNTTAMMDLVDDDALKVLETIITICREPNGRALQKRVQSFRVLQRLAITYDVKLSKSLWYHYFMGQVTLLERTKGKFTKYNTPAKRKTFSLKLFETELRRVPKKSSLSSDPIDWFQDIKPSYW